MSLNILLADDSVPAQNMGKKILVDAGYSVLTVSNGLEALRKIDEMKPEIAILDIFMPGYTGLEICEKLRSNAATASLPVVLTVGKLEPYRPEEGEHVHSNAVIVKPFAAGELVGAVRSLIGAPHELAPEPEPPAPEPFHEEEEELPAVDSFATPASHEDAADVESLRFDPDATHTPFHAAAGDFLGSPASGGSGKVASAFAGLDLGEDEPGFATAPAHQAVEVPAFEENTFPVHEGAPQFETQAVEPPATFAAEPSPDVPVVGAVPEIPLEPPQPTPVQPAPVSAEQSPVIEYAGTDPLFEVQEHRVEQPSGVLDSSTLEVGDLPEQTFGNPEPEVDEEEYLSEEQKARRDAFEALFNSDEPLPVQEYPAEPVKFPEPPAELGQVEVAPAEPSYVEPPVGDSIPAEPAADHMAAALETFTPSAEAPAYDHDPLLDEGFSSPVESATQAAEAPFVEPQPAVEWNPEPVIEHSVEHVVPEAAFEPVPEPFEAHFGEPVETIEVPAAIEPEASILQVEHELEPRPSAEIPAFEPQPEEIVVEEPETPVAIPPSVAASTEQDVSLASLPAQDLVEAETELVSGQFAAEPPAQVEPAQSLQQFESLELEQTEPESYGTEILSMEVPEAEQVQAENVPVPEPEPEPTAQEPFAALHPTPVPAPHEVVVGDEAVSESERVHEAVERVFEKFKPLLTAAIVRELARHE